MKQVGLSLEWIADPVGLHSVSFVWMVSGSRLLRVGQTWAAAKTQPLTWTKQTRKERAWHGMGRQRGSAQRVQQWPPSHATQHGTWPFCFRFTSFDSRGSSSDSRFLPEPQKGHERTNKGHSAQCTDDVRTISVIPLQPFTCVFNYVEMID